MWDMKNVHWENPPTDRSCCDQVSQRILWKSLQTFKLYFFQYLHYALITRVQIVLLLNFQEIVRLKNFAIYIFFYCFIMSCKSCKYNQKLVFGVQAKPSYLKGGMKLFCAESCQPNWLLLITSFGRWGEKKSNYEDGKKRCQSCITEKGGEGPGLL